MVDINEFGFYASFLHSIGSFVLDKYNLFLFPSKLKFDEKLVKNISPYPLSYPKYFIIFTNLKKEDEFNQKIFIESNIYVWNDNLFYVHFKRHIIRFIRQADKFYISKVWKVFNDNYIRIQNFHTLVYMLENKYFDGQYNTNKNKDIIKLVGEGREALDYLMEYYDIFGPPSE